jgi:hypothetical protein
LRDIERGGYLDLVYNQFKSGKRGTLIGVGDKFAKSKVGRNSEKDEKRRAFFQFLAESRPGGIAKTA